MQALAVSSRKVVSTAFLLGCSSISACDCAFVLDESSADLVFVGVARIQHSLVEAPPASESGALPDNVVDFTFDVESVVKGASALVLTVRSSATDSCSVAFDKGKRYRVFASADVEPPLIYRVSPCSHTVKVE
jgi:hypothetical protein